MASQVIYTPPSVLGWNYAAEDRDALLFSSRRPPLIDKTGIARPKNRDPELYLPIENQGQIGSCAGNAMATLLEMLMVIGGFPHTQLSRMGAYIMAQKLDGISGDRGSTIEGNCRNAEQNGLVLESVWTYPSRYDASVPSGYATATKYKLAGHAPCTGWDDAMAHLWEGEGGIDYGIIWSSDIDEQVSRNKGIVSTYSGRGGGGHSIAGVGWRETHWDGSALGETMMVVDNSWSQQWGYKGKFLVTRKAFESMVQNSMNVLTKVWGCAAPAVPDFVIPEQAR